MYHIYRSPDNYAGFRPALAEHHGAYQREMKSVQVMEMTTVSAIRREVGCGMPEAA